MMPVPRQMNSKIDPEARRNTPLAAKLKHRIQLSGPISVEDFVQACLYDPEHGYYVCKPAIGQSSDFITAPEISQVFGELLGIWTIMTWQQLGSPVELNLVELGPGRGTMMADALRAIAKVPELGPALRIHLVDSNEVLRQSQLSRLQGQSSAIRHHTSMAELADFLAGDTAPNIVLANEFVDALGVRQHIMSNKQWCQRTVDVNGDGQLIFSVGREAALSEVGPAANGAIREANPTIDAGLRPLLASLARHAPLAALFIDYGYTEPTIGETLQAMRAHAYEHPLTSPGEADLTAHVDFSDLAGCLSSSGFWIDGPVTQAEFLGRLGIIERTSQLMALNPEKAAALEAGTMRLLAPNGMGIRFKAIGARNWDGSALTGLTVAG
ncbi:MAG: SAM-dependent methyltransferase [Pseudomonadota bacterium]